MRLRIATALALALGLASFLAPLQGDLPSSKEQEQLVEEYYATDWKSPEGMARHDEIFARLELLPALDASGLKRWTKKLDKLWKKGPKLEKKSGRHYLWEKEKRGLYIVGGKGKKPAGLFLGMHGGGLGSGDANTSHGAFSSAASDKKWLAIFPEVLVKTERGWTDSGTEEFVLELLERARRTWDTDPDQTFFGGHSMGGYGTWTLGAHHADMVAALTPSAGAPTPILDRASGSVIDIVPGVIPNLRNVPIVIYQSSDDPNVPPEVNRIAAKRLGEAQKRWGAFEYEYWEVDGRAHDLPPGGTTALLEKVREHRRNPYPERIVWEPTLSWKRHFYWLWWDAPVNEALVLADLKRDENAIDITYNGTPTGLFVLLREELVDMSKEVIVRLNGKETYRGIPEPSLAVLVSTARRGDERLTFTTRVPVTP